MTGLACGRCNAGRRRERTRSRWRRFTIRDPVEALGAGGADEGSAIAFVFGTRTVVLMIWMSSLAKTESKSRVNLLSRSRIRQRNRSSLSLS